MNVFDLFSTAACSLGGAGSLKWSWEEYYQKCKELKAEDVSVVLVDMIKHPVSGSVPISNELFAGEHPDGTYFALYCHSGGSSGFLQKKLTVQFPKYNFVNMAGGIGAYQPE